MSLRSILCDTFESTWSPKVVGFAFWRDDFVHSLHVRSAQARTGVGGVLMSEAERAIAEPDFPTPGWKPTPTTPPPEPSMPLAAMWRARFPDQEGDSGLTTLPLVKRLASSV